MEGTSGPADIAFGDPTDEPGGESPPSAPLPRDAGWPAERDRLLDALRVREARVARLEEDLAVLAERSETLDRIVSGGWWRLRSRLRRVVPLLASARRLAGRSGRVAQTAPSDPLSDDALATRAAALRDQRDRLASGVGVTRAPCDPTQPARRVICSLADENYLGPLSICAVGLKEYGAIHGWDVVIRVGSLADDRPIAWSKMLLVRDLLEEYDEVWWVDADAVIVDPTRDIARELDPAKDLHIVEHRWDDPPGRNAINTGVMLVRRSAWSSQLLDAVWANERFIHHEWWENTSMLDLFGYDIPADGTPPARGTDTSWLEHVQLLDIAWNSTENASAAPHPVIRHIGRRSTTAVLERMMLDELRRSRALRAAAPPVA